MYIVSFTSDNNFEFRKSNTENNLNYLLESVTQWQKQGLRSGF